MARHIFQHLQLWGINIWQQLDHLPSAATYMLTCVSEIPITLYWIVKRLLRLCFLQMLHARWISPIALASNRYGDLWICWNRKQLMLLNWQKFHIGNKQQVGEACVRSRRTPSAPKHTLKSFLCEQRKWKWTKIHMLSFFHGCPSLKVLSNESMTIIRTSLIPNWDLSKEHNFARNLYLMVILRAKCPQLVTITSCCVVTLLTGDGK